MTIVSGAALTPSLLEEAGALIAGAKLEGVEMLGTFLCLGFLGPRKALPGLGEQVVVAVRAEARAFLARQGLESRGVSHGLTVSLRQYGPCWRARGCPHQQHMSVCTRRCQQWAQPCAACQSRCHRRDCSRHASSNSALVSRRFGISVAPTGHGLWQQPWCPRHYPSPGLVFLLSSAHARYTSTLTIRLRYRFSPARGWPCLQCVLRALIAPPPSPRKIFVLCVTASRCAGLQHARFRHK